MPVEWAQTINNLAKAYYSRIKGERADNYEQAISCYQQALEVTTRSASPIEWALTNNNLGAAYFERIKGERADNYEQAISYYRQTLEVTTRLALPVEWAQTMNNLATTYWSRIKGERADNIEQAITCYQQVLEVHTRTALPAFWAMAMNNLAAAYSGRIKGERAENNQRALVAYQKSLEIRTLAAMPHQHRQTQQNLAILYFLERRWAKAHAAYAAALTASDLLYQAGGTTEARQLELREVRDFPAQAAYCLAKLGRFSETVKTLEQGKARALAEALARNEAALEAASTTDQADFESVRQRIKALEAEARAEDQEWARDFLTVSADLRQERDELSAIVARIRDYVPEFMPEGLDFFGIKWVAEALNQPLIYLLTTSHGSLALLVPHNHTEDGKEASEVEAIWTGRFPNR